jgi:hypothetical protein
MGAGQRAVKETGDFGGEALLRLNLDKRVVERQLLVAVGRYPR